MAAAMRAALTASGLAPADIGWVSAHGTGTPRSDAAESLALHTVFGDTPPPVSSIKGALGHALGAATALEAVVSVRSLGDAASRAQCRCRRGRPGPRRRRRADAREAPDLDWVLSCGYAFGGLELRPGPREGGMTTTTGEPPLGERAPRRAGEAVAAWVAARLTEAEPALPGGDRVALHVATPDSGSREALAFWRAAQTTGFALAAPGAFPWTLSNSVTGRISLALGVTGPCTTWVGGQEAATEAELAARLDLEDGVADHALVVTVAGWSRRMPPGRRCASCSRSRCSPPTEAAPSLAVTGSTRTWVTNRRLGDRSSPTVGGRH